MQYIERDNSKLKPENHTVTNRMQYDNRTIKRQYKIPYKFNSSRLSDNKK